MQKQQSNKQFESMLAYYEKEANARQAQNIRLAKQIKNLKANLQEVDSDLGKLSAYLPKYMCKARHSTKLTG